MANKVSVNAWTGGSDSGTERVWKWMDGPEAGQTYTCQKFGTGGTGAEGTIDGVVCTEQSYLNWDFGEPNQYNGTNEDYMHVYGTGAKKGSWNDYVINDNKVDAYIIEYGGMGGTATVQGTATISITSTEASDSTYTAFDALIEIHDKTNDHYAVTQVTAIHDGTTPYFTEFGYIDNFSNNSAGIGTVGVGYSSTSDGDIELRLTPPANTLIETKVFQYNFNETGTGGVGFVTFTDSRLKSVEGAYTLEQRTILSSHSI